MPFRILLAISLTAALTSSVQSRPAQPHPAPPDQWPQFRQNHANNGVAPSAPPASLRLLWTFEAKESIESSAAIVDGAVYFGSQSGHLISLDLASGKERWRYAVDQGIGESSPAVAQGLVFVGDLSGKFHAVDTRTGKVRWTFKTGTEIKSSPVVVDEMVLIGSYDEHLYALNLKSGVVAWTYKINGPVHATPAIVNGVALLTGCDEVFHAVRVTDGKLMYQVRTGAYTGASPAIDGVFAYFGTFENQVLALNLTTRRVVWRYEHKQRHFPFYASAAIAAGTVIAAGRDKMIHALDQRTGKARWTFMTKARVESSPAVVAGKIYVGSNDGTFYVLELATGKKLWEFTAGAPLSTSPAISQGRIVIGDQDGRLYCFGG